MLEERSASQSRESIGDRKLQGEKSDICTQVEKSERKVGCGCLTSTQSGNGKGEVGHGCLTRTNRKWEQSTVAWPQQSQTEAYLYGDDMDRTSTL